MAAPWERYADQPSIDGPWAKYSAPEPTPQQIEDEKVRKQDGFGDRFRRFSDLVMDPFNVSDEIRGAGAAVRGFVTSGGSTEEAGKAYTEAAELARAERRVASEANNPAIAGRQIPLWQIAGGFLTTGPSAALNPAGQVPSFWRTAGQSAKVGGTYGAVSGLTSSEGGAENRLLGALEGGAIGAVAGPAISNVLLPLASRAYGGLKAGLDRKSVV